MKKSITLISQEYKMSGIHRMESQLIKEWRKQGHTVNIIDNKCRSVDYDDLESKPVETIRESRVFFVKFIKRIKRFKQYFKAHPDDMIVALGWRQGCWAAVIGKFVKNRVLISERNDPTKNPTSAMRRRLRNFCFRLADVCVFQTEDAMNYFSPSIRKKGVVIPNPINEQIPVFDIKERENYIIAVGRLNPQKNFHMLLKAFASFHQQYPVYTLDIYGDGVLLEELTAYARELGVASAVNFKGFSSDVYPLMAKAAMYVSSSDYEGISNSMLEALAIGVPTICTDCPVGGARQMIEDGVNGLLTPVGDAKAFADAMCRIAGDKEFAERIAKNATDIRKKYPIQVIADKWIQAMG